MTNKLIKASHAFTGDVIYSGSSGRQFKDAMIKLKKELGFPIVHFIKNDKVFTNFVEMSDDLRCSQDDIYDIKVVFQENLPKCLGSVNFSRSSKYKPGDFDVTIVGRFRHEPCNNTVYSGVCKQCCGKTVYSIFSKNRDAVSIYDYYDIIDTAEYYDGTTADIIDTILNCCQRHMSHLNPIMKSQYLKSIKQYN
jgi:hypothetical protein